MIIHRYIFKEILPPFGVSLIFFSFVFTMTQLPEITNYVVNYNIGLATVGLMLLYSMPYFLQFIIPISVMIGVLLTFLRMSGDMEILALKAGGVHVYRLLPPVLLFGLLGTLLAAYMSIYGIPSGRIQTKQLLINVAAAHAGVGLKPRQFIDIYKDVIIYVHEIDNATKTLTDVFIEDRKSDQLTSTIIAPRGQLSYDADQSVAALRLHHGTIHQVDLAQQRANKIDFETYDLRLDVSRGFESLKKGGSHVSEMSLSELHHTLRAAQKKDKDYYKALKEWHKKFSLPAACLIMALLAVPLGIRARSSQRAYGIGLGLFFFLLYYVMLSIGWVLGESGFYPPALGMWIPNAVILTIAVILLVRTAKEKPAHLPTMPIWLMRRLPRNPWARQPRSPEPSCGPDLRRNSRACRPCPTDPSGGSRVTPGFDNCAAQRSHAGWTHAYKPLTTIIGRYVTREIVRYFGIILLIVLGIYLTVDFIEKIDNFIKAGLAWQRAFLFFAYKLPFIMVQMTPVGILLAVMITFGLMAKNNELLALRISGVNLVSLIGPMAWCGLAAALLMIVIAEGVMPHTISQANQIWLQEVKGHKETRIRQSDIWLKGDETILHLKLFHPDRQEAEGITLHRFDPHFKLTERIDANAGLFQDGAWMLRRGIIQHQADQFTVRMFDELHTQLGFSPEDLAYATPKPEEMGFLQLRRFIRKVETEGYDATRYRVDLQAKGAFPFISLIMTLMGAGLAARGKLKAGLPSSVAFGLGIAFIYWVVFSFCLSLGYAGTLAPVIAAWGVNLIFMCLAGYLLVNAD